MCPTLSFPAKDREDLYIAGIADEVTEGRPHALLSNRLALAMAMYRSRHGAKYHPRFSGEHKRRIEELMWNTLAVCEMQKMKAMGP